MLQLVLLLVWIIITLISYFGGLWGSSGLIGRKKIFQFLMFRFLPSAWLISSLFIGLFLVVKVPKQLTNFSVLMTIVLPMVALLTILFSLANENRKLKQKQREEKDKMELKRSECQEWLRSISFINSKDVTLKLYLSNNKATGRMIITNVTKEQNEIIRKEYLESLPNEIFLEIITENNGLFH